MEFLYSTELAVPLYQIALLLILSTLALLFGRLKLALLINYLFTLYWGYLFNCELMLGSSFEKVTYFSSIYFAVGFLVAILAIIGFVSHRD